jgi:hypothetical protein
MSIVFSKSYENFLIFFFLGGDFTTFDHVLLAHGHMFAHSAGAS